MAINRVYADKENILIQDDENKLWIMGSNIYRRTGMGIRSETIHIPQFTKIKLEPNEYVSNFYVHDYFVSIFTSSGKLYVSRFLYQKLKTLQDSDDSEPESGTIIREYEDSVSGEDSGSSTEESECEDIKNVLHNDTYIKKLDKIVPLIKRKITKTGFDLIDDKIDDIIFVDNTIFFLKNDTIYLYNAKIKPHQMLYETVSMEMKLMKCKNDNTIYYYQLILPFDYDECLLEKNFVYVKSGSYHHIITGSDEDTDEGYNFFFVWYYFKYPMDDIHKHIYYNASSDSLYLENKNEIYLFCAESKTFKKYIDGDSINLFIPYLDETNYDLITNKNGKIYRDNNGLTKELKIKKKISNCVVNMKPFGESHLIIIDTDTKPSQDIIVTPEAFYFNVRSLVYRVVNDGLIYYDASSGLICYCAEYELEESKYDTFILKSCENDSDFLYVYAYNNIPSNITNITFTNNLFVIQSEKKYYYQIFDSVDFNENKITEIILNDKNDIELVNKRIVVYNKNEYDESVDLYVSSKSDKLPKLMNIIELLRDQVDFQIKFTEGTSVVSYGDGPKREFMDVAMIEFADKYLLYDGTCPDFNLDQLEKLNDDDLIFIGYMIHAVICHSLNHLPIRLPLHLIQAILNKIPSDKELEYFIMKYDPELYHNIQLHKNKPNSEFESAFGYASYRECLESLCRLTYDEKTQIKISHITKLISKGFRKYYKIKKLNKMNFPTFDYYLSGDFHINRDLLLKNLIINSETKLTVNCTEIIKQVIHHLSEEKMTLLLKNWSATSIVKNTSYRINIVSDYDKDIYFGTCNFELTLSDNLFENSEIDNLLVELLTTPIDHMIDP